MIDEYNADRTGYAQFSDDRVMRYHLVRMVSEPARAEGLHEMLPAINMGAVRWPGLRVAVFLMLNPSDADAFKPDPTVRNCVLFTQRWEFDITWAVNLNAFRSPWPKDLKKRAMGFRGDDHQNNVAILTACRSANVVVAAWGNDGGLDCRDHAVRALLKTADIKLHHMGLTKTGFPKHPMARGVHRISADQQPVPWS